MLCSEIFSTKIVWEQHMNLTHRYAAGIAFVGAGLFISTSAHALVAIPETTFYLSANCVDCASEASVSAFPVTAELTLAGYALGDTITSGNFVSFYYGGSNLVDSFSITDGGTPINGALHGFSNSSIYEISGSITNPSGSNEFSVTFDDALFFSTHFDGTWEACAPGQNGYYGSSSCSIGIPTDFGDNAFYSTTPVPEPGTAAMILAALLPVGVMVRRRRRQQI
jgi:hypothetical protein